MRDEVKLMRIKELVELTGVSAQTIHYYLREGLLPPPIKTAPNMAYYGPEYVEDIRLIKELQERRFLPLSVIKVILDAKHKGKDISDLMDMRLSLEALFQPLSPEEDLEAVTLIELVALAELGIETLETLEGMDLLMPTLTPEGKRYDDLDVRVARSAKRLLELGLSLADLSCYSDLVAAVRAEVRIVREKVFSPSQGRHELSGREIRDLIDALKAALTAKIYRQAILDESQSHEQLSARQSETHRSGL